MFTGGIDEAGRGPVIGPMVIVGVAITSEKQSIVDNLIIKDSKNLSIKKRTELAKILLHKPKIILLDEPEINLDKNSIKILKEIILSERKKGAAVILCTHSEEFMSEVGQRFFSIDNGELITS